MINQRDIKGLEDNFIVKTTHGFDNDFIYNNGTTWIKAQADDIDTTATHFAIKIDDNNFKIIITSEVDLTGLLDDLSNALVI